jgi:hypothetical protein
MEYITSKPTSNRCCYKIRTGKFKGKYCGRPTTNTYCDNCIHTRKNLVQPSHETATPTFGVQCSYKVSNNPKLCCGKPTDDYQTYCDHCLTTRESLKIF